jgi:hypothetical protein
MHGTLFPLSDEWNTEINILVQEHLKLFFLMLRNDVYKLTFFSCNTRDSALLILILFIKLKTGVCLPLIKYNKTAVSV